MSTNICFIYPWATFGGCERVLLNRVMAFKAYLPDIHIDFLFLHDGGGLKAFQAALGSYGLTDIAKTVSALESQYDLISLIDCPQYLEKLKSSRQKYIVECHTAYPENRKYLAQLGRNSVRIVTPSHHFSSLVMNEFGFSKDRVFVLRNFVPWDIPQAHALPEITLPAWRPKPVLFFGRLDSLKDPVSLLDAFCILEKQCKGEFMLLFCGPQSTEIDITKEISARKLIGSIVQLPPVPFISASALMQAVSVREGIFVSPSRGESFGLSAAEAICALLPVALSDIDAHKILVGQYHDLFTYSQGSANSLARQIRYLADYRKESVKVLLELRQNFSAETFLQDWHYLIENSGN